MALVAVVEGGDPDVGVAPATDEPECVAKPQLVDVDVAEGKTWPKEARGVGMTEAPRGALGHWIRIKDGKIENYQCVVPTTWNGSPRDPKGNIGAFEASLMDTPMADPNQPLEIIRTLHSFDPCLACSTHVMSPDGQEMAKVTVR